MYDQYGMEGIKQNISGGGMDANDIFSQFFGGGGSRRSNQRPRTENIVRDYPVALEDLYKGKLSKFKVTHKIICKDCKGRGGSEGCEKVCSSCNGRGVCVRVLRRGNVIQQMQSPCTVCNGKGIVIDPAKRCKVCNGQKVVPETKIIEVSVERGMKEGSKIVLPSAADESPNADAGDIVYIVKEKKHPLFSRNGPDLSITLNISLAEALCGFTRTITHLDGRKLCIRIPEGEVTTPNSVKVIRNEGMPVRGSGMLFGSLFVFFKVDFPKRMDVNVCKQLATVLNKPADEEPDEEADMCVLSDSSASQYGNSVREPEMEEENVGYRVFGVIFSMMMMVHRDNQVLVVSNNKLVIYIFHLLCLLLIRNCV